MISDICIALDHSARQTTIEALTYQYDAAGNRTALTRANAAASLIPAAVTNTAFDAANQQTRFNSTTTNLTYDANGNLTSFTDPSGTTSYAWNARNQLTGISGPSLSASFVYDGLGRRKSKIINGTTTGFWYDGNDVLAELSGSTPTATYVRSLSIDEPFIRKQSGGDEFYQTDALGSTLALTNSSGAPGPTYGYEPFGKTTAAGSSSNPFQYTGRENDGTGLSYYRARYYSPLQGRFLIEDPIEFGAEDTNRYAYVYNNPTNLTDPSGEIVAQLVACAIGAGISISVDLLGGRKPDLLNAGIGCLTGAVGLRLAAELPRLYPPLFHFLNHNRYLRIGYGRSGRNMVPRVSVGNTPGGPHSRLWP